MRVLEYNDVNGRSPYGAWFDSLDAVAAAKMTVAVTRMGHGYLSNAKSVGKGVLEFVIDFGPGYRIYLGRDGDDLIILVGGGTKQGQQADIATAKARWADYKERTAALRKKEKPKRGKKEGKKKR
jgi:putative addiction module killer protein